MTIKAMTPNTKNPKDRPLNMRERKLIKGIAAGLTPTAAMRAAGYTEQTSRTKAGMKVSESRIAKTIQELMEDRGLTRDKLLEKLNEGLVSTKLVGETLIETPDYATRHKYLDTGLKLGAHYPKEKIEHSGVDGGPLQIMLVKYDQRMDVADAVDGEWVLSASNPARQGARTDGSK